MRMSKALAKTGDLNRALEFSREALSIYNSLSEANPEIVRKFLIAVHEIIVGDLLRMKGDARQAIVSYRDVVAMLEPWAAAEPANAIVLRHLGSTTETSVACTRWRLPDRTAMPSSDKPPGVQPRPATNRALKSGKR
jgi:hypothetical protein